MTSSRPGRAATPLLPFLEARAAIAAERLGNGGTDVCARLTALLDDGLVELFGEHPPGTALVAVGGYGRGEMCLRSDVDVMVLHRGRRPDGAAHAVFYPLWDAKLAVGHAVRTVRQAVTAAEERVETLCSLLTARHLAGDPALLAQLTDGLAALLAGSRRRLDRVLAAEEHERRRAEPYHLLAVNLKTGRGGLRTLHGIGWDRSRVALTGGAPEEAAAGEEEARRTLLAVRNALHAVTGKAYDEYDASLRGPVATWLGSDPVTVGRRLYAAVRNAERAADRQWPDVGQSDRVDPVALTGRWMLRAFRTITTGRGARRNGGSPSLAAAEALLEDPQRALTAEEGAAISAASPPNWTAQDRAVLIRMLAAGERGQQVFEELDRLGWIGAAIPEWRHVVAAPQLDPLHLHPVDVHLWRTVHELLAVTGPDSDEPLCRSVAEDLGSLDEALLAALFHDIGKGRGGDHSVVGAELAGAAGARMGFEPQTVGRLRTVVRHHLLLPQVSTRRDLDDPEVVAEIAGAAGDARTLRTLYLLSVADSRATGPATWTPWKATLLRSAFTRAVRLMEGAAPAPEAEVAAAAVVVLAEGRHRRADVAGHVAGMPEGYVARFEPEEILAHLDLATPRPGVDEVRIRVADQGPTAHLVVVTADRPGVLSTVSGVLALHNVAVLDARVATRADGVAIDSFFVQDALEAAEVPPERWAHVERDLERAVAGEFDLEAALDAKAATYPAPRNGRPTSVTVHRLPDRAIVEVRAADRVALLHDLSRALFDLGLSVDLARVDTRADGVVDVFYVDAPRQGSEAWDHQVAAALTAAAERRGA